MRLCYAHLMARMFHWDYRRPYYYLVTVACLPNLPPLSKLQAEDVWGIDPAYPITRALATAVRVFLSESPGIESLSPYVLMPDHAHFLIKLADIPNQRTLGSYVRILKARLRQAYCLASGVQTDLFAPDFHDLIVKQSFQLAAFRQYIRGNPRMLLLRRSHRDRFHCYRDYRHWRLGEQACDAVGNPELLDEPICEAIRVSRSVTEGSPAWNELMARLETWRPGMVAVGTWWSAGERATYRAILVRGGSVICLSPRGFPTRWHPAGEEAQRDCAAGRVLYLSPYPPENRLLPPGETRRRCLDLNTLALAIAAARPPTR